MGARPNGSERVLTEDALAFVAELEARFGPQRRALLAARRERQARFDAGERPDFLAETAELREADWRIEPVPEILRDRRVEITGPVDRKMMINALNSGARVFMADFEDASAPTFESMVAGQDNMIDHRDGTLTHRENGKDYAVGDKAATMIVRPRGWHLDEAHARLGGEAVSASLFDFGLHMFHCGKALAEQGRGPFYYLPKLENRLEARLWDAVFVHAQERLGLPVGTIKATVLIETLPAAFEMDEILFELRRHAAGLNCGRWDYIFSYIKTLGEDPAYLLPDRAEVGMDRAFLEAYSIALIQTCHRRGAHAMGGMAAQIPVKGDETANAAAFDKVRADKLREFKLGHDGTWVAHPALVPVALAAFDAHMDGPNQIGARTPQRTIAQSDLLAPHSGSITEAGARANIEIGIRYIAAWLSGRGAVPIHNLMEDAATAEISRSQIWQWIRHGAPMLADTGDTRAFDRAWALRLIEATADALRAEHGETGYARGRFAEATSLFCETALGARLEPFLTLPAYETLQRLHADAA